MNVCAVLGDFFRIFRNPVDLPGRTTREGVAPPYLLTSPVKKVCLTRSALSFARLATMPVDIAESEIVRSKLGSLVAERDRLRKELADHRGSAAGSLGFASAAPTKTKPVENVDAVEVTEMADLDLDSARAVLGIQIVLDDLRVVEGIGPKITELCAGIGVMTSQQLAESDVETLQSMLDAAGSRFRMHRPASWPQQAALLASGQWEEFVALTETLAGS